MHPELVQFLLGLAALLGVARGLGEICRKLGLPAVMGEILAGILIGKTLLGRVAAPAFTWLFPTGTVQTLLSGYTTVAVVLLLVVAGLEIDLSVVRRSGRGVLLTSLLGALVPFALGWGMSQILPDSDLADPSRRGLHAAFLGIALSISALPVIARTLMDLGILKTEIGLLVISSAVVDDLIGWTAFSVLARQFASHEEASLAGIGISVGMTIVFVVLTLLVVRPLADLVLAKMQPDPATEPPMGRVLSLIMVLALLGAAATQALGMHAVFGGFVMGLAVGDSKRLRQHTRHVLQEFVTHVFTPVFFATMALRIDFAEAFDLRLIGIVLAISCVAKVAGCAVGSRVSGAGWREALAIGFGMNSRGAMEILLASLALEAKIIRPSVFVSLVVMAIVTSMISGPAVSRLLKGQSTPLADMLTKGVVLVDVAGTTPGDIVRALSRALAARLGMTGDGNNFARLVLEREEQTSTGLGDGCAIPHAEVEGIDEPVLAFARTHEGIDFNSPDGKPVRLVFMLLTPPKAFERELRILAQLARTLRKEGIRKGLLTVHDRQDVISVLVSARPIGSIRGSMVSITGERIPVPPLPRIKS